MKNSLGKEKSKKTFFEGIIHSWWVVLFVLFCAIIYERRVRTLNENRRQLIEKLDELQNEKSNLLKLQEELQLQINSQNDPEWIELTLMKNLGLVPEGQYKIYIQKAKESVYDHEDVVR
jgi:hypothetical protein